ncbi:hypothetical protein CA51_14570 [Rosistilla oblonga]|uniref:Uncharacterized protein n=1 Tax=Rosistilla oblonga TaxID=2527990 RepID=A0A518IR63_9BACT|nr:hypothetical protein [Rosistilla oblonga]QDV11587.1 hypothetical protein CA51_14570 [Rosistilla oblonga]QDV55578.1 hypothetical protein Mal33_15550 [Rosistilla oblonga]
MGSRPEQTPLNASHRVDDAHPDFRMSRRGMAAELDAGQRDADRMDHLLEALLPNHARELIDKLQSWSEVLDRREAELNSRVALFEHRQRTHRMREQSRSSMMEEQERALQRQHQALRDDLRRFAVGNIQVQM